MPLSNFCAWAAIPRNPRSGEPSNVLAGNPVTTTHNYFTDPTGRFYSGIWESTPGKWSMRIQGGRVRLSDRRPGEADRCRRQGRNLRPGSAFLIPAGFKGSWETIETLEEVLRDLQPAS